MRSMHQPIRIPADWEPHKCCWMAWAVDRRDWENIDKVKHELSEVIQTIARYEPVYVLARRGTGYREAKREFATCHNVTVVAAPVDDIWMRDIAPTFAWRGHGAAQEIVAIDWNFNGWGNTRDRPPRPGDRLARTAASIFGVPCISAPFVAEGGALVTDGRGTMITTRSCLLNPNRNPVRNNQKRQQLIEENLSKFGIEQVIWLEGDPCEPVTSGHIDGYVLIAPSVILVEINGNDEIEPPMWREHDVAILEKLACANDRKVELVRVLTPRRKYWKTNVETFAPNYLNAYIANGAVITGWFGDAKRDVAAKNSLARAFPDRDIMMLRIDTITAGGGGVHCLTQSMPAK